MNLQTSQIEKEILEQRALKIARPLNSETTDYEKLHLLEFTLGRETYGIEILYVYEVQPLQKLKWAIVPNTPEFIIGAVNIRGRIHSMMDIRRFMGLPGCSLLSSAQVILVKGIRKNAEMVLCLITDNVPRIYSIPYSELLAESGSLSGKTKGFAKGVTREMLIILDMDRLLADPGLIINDVK